MFWCEAARFALLYLKMHVSSCFDSLHTPSKPWFYLQVSRLLPLFSSISFSTPFSISLSPSNLLLASCFPVLLFGCYGEGQPVRVCASMSMSVCVCVCVCVGKPEPEGVGRRLKVTQKQSHTHTVASGPETWTCADMLSVLTGHSERSVHRCNVYTTYVCVYVWERERVRARKRDK